MCPGSKNFKVAKEGTLAFEEATNPIGYPCPHFDAVKGTVEKKLEPEAKIIDRTH